MKNVLIMLSKYVVAPILAFFIILELPIREDVKAVLCIILLIVWILAIIVPPIFRRSVGKFGVQALAYIEASTIQNAYIVARYIQFDRVDAEVLVIEENGEKFRAKVRFYREDWEARSFGPHQKAIVRYLPFYKKRVAFDSMHYSKRRKEVVEEFYRQRRKK